MTLRTILSHTAVGCAITLGFVGLDQAVDNSTFSVVLFFAIVATGIFAGLFLFVLGPPPRKAAPPAADYPDTIDAAAQPAPPAAQIHVYPTPATPAPAPAWPTPQPPQRPVQAGDFQEPRGPSIFDPLPPDVPSYNPRRSQYSQPSRPFDPLFDGPGAALPPLEQEPTRSGPLPWSNSSPWDDDPAPAYTGPLHAGPLLPRRAPAPAEIDLIRSVYAEEGTLNATIRRVYGAKDAKTHGWTKGALEL